MKPSVTCFGALVLLSCAAPEAEIDETLRVRARVSGELESEHPLRQVVLWVKTATGPGGDPVYRSLDRPYDAGEQLTLDLAVPPDVELASLKYLDSVEVPLPPTTTPGRRNPVITGYRPRIVIYEDVDDDGHFDAPAVPNPSFVLLEIDGGMAGGVDAGVAQSDRMVAVDDEQLSVVAFADPKGAVAAMRLGDAQRFYELVGGLRRFGYTTSRGSALAPADDLVLLAGHPPILETNVLCGRYVAGAADAIETQVFVDEPLDAIAVCGLEHADCASVKLESVSVDWEFAEGSSSRRDPSASTLSQCKHDERLEVLHLVEQSTSCTDCYCRVERQQTTYVVSRSAVPGWWPCGVDVPFCDQGPLSTPALACSPANEGYLDAGVHSRPLMEAGALPDASGAIAAEGGREADERPARDM